MADSATTSVVPAVKQPHDDSVLSKLTQLLTPNKHHRSDSGELAAQIVSARPGGLPAKSAEEAARHAKQLLEIQKAAAARAELEEKVAKHNSQKSAEREEVIFENSKEWEQYLPRWHLARRQKKVEALGLQGIPPRLRERVWKIALGNAIFFTADSYKVFSARDASERSISNIDQDLPRTYHGLAFFAQDGGPLYEPLRRILLAYCSYRPDVGYVQGMAYLAGMILLYAEEEDAFKLFCNVLLSPMLMTFYTMEGIGMQKYLRVWNVLLEQQSPAAARHFERIGIRPDMYLLDWIMTVFSKSLPIDVGARVWDSFVIIGDCLLMRVGCGIIRLLESRIVQSDFDDCIRLLQRLPPLPANEIMKSTAEVPLTMAQFDDMLCDVDQ